MRLFCHTKPIARWMSLECEINQVETHQENSMIDWTFF